MTRKDTPEQVADEQFPRDDCFFCGSDGSLDTHHIFPQRYGGSDTESNLVDLCKECHVKIEHLYRESTFWSNLEIEKSEHPPAWDSDDYVVLDSIDLTVGPSGEVEPIECSVCMRMGPWERVTHQPTGYPAWKCVRCSTDHGEGFGNASEWSGVHLWTHDTLPDADLLEEGPA